MMELREKSHSGSIAEAENKRKSSPADHLGSPGSKIGRLSRKAWFGQYVIAPLRIDQAPVCCTGSRKRHSGSIVEAQNVDESSPSSPSRIPRVSRLNQSDQGCLVAKIDHSYMGSYRKDKLFQARWRKAENMATSSFLHSPALQSRDSPPSRASYRGFLTKRVIIGSKTRFGDRRPRL